MAELPALAVLAAALALAGCATRVAEAPPGADPVGGAVEQPFRDLGVIREVAPETLVRALSEPYRRPTDCASLEQELQALDKALGPDVDTTPGRTHFDLATSLVGGAGSLIGGVFGLPYADIVRRVTGAQERERAYKAAVLSGMVRRAYLKGSRRGLGCREPATVAAGAP